MLGKVRSSRNSRDDNVTGHNSYGDMQMMSRQMISAVLFCLFISQIMCCRTSCQCL